MTKEEIIGRFFQIFFIAITFLIMYLAGWKFFIISFIFVACGGAFEFIIINQFYSKQKIKIAKKDENITKIKNAFLWVHKTVDFIKRYNATIYNFNKIGYLVSSYSYFIMYLYVIIAFFLFKQFSYYGFLIYLVPVISNVFSFFRNKYFITD